MAELTKTINKVFDMMERDNRGVQLGCYSVALLGLGVAIRKVRPFSRFRKPSDIPNHFIKERRELVGTVERIDPNGGLLMVKHKPLVRLPGLPVGQLPVKLSGINVTGLGVNWLQTIVVGSEVRFVPVSKGQEWVQCQVLLPQSLPNNKQRLLNVAETLVRIGFGQVAPSETPISKDKQFLRYYNQLQAAEKYAIKRQLGYRYYIKPTTAFLYLIGRNLHNVVLKIYRQIIQIPRMSTS